MTQPLIPFAIHKDTGKVVDISSVDVGLNCGCICPGCYADVVAKKGDINRWHFAHHLSEADDYCSFAFNAGVRCFILQELNKLTDIYVPCTALFKNRKLTINAVEAEQHENSPVDFFIYAHDACIAVCLTHAQHPFDRDLLGQLSKNYAILEIRLSEFYPELRYNDNSNSSDVILNLISNSITSKYWRRPPDKCYFPLRPQFEFNCVTCGLIWQGHEYNNLCEECCSPLMVLRNPVS